MSNGVGSGPLAASKRIGCRSPPKRVLLARRFTIRLVAARPHAAAHVEAPDPDIIMRRSATSERTLTPATASTRSRSDLPLANDALPGWLSICQPRSSRLRNLNPLRRAERYRFAEWLKRKLDIKPQLKGRMTVPTAGSFLDGFRTPAKSTRPAHPRPASETLYTTCPHARSAACRLLPRKLPWKRRWLSADKGPIGDIVRGLDLTNKIGPDVSYWRSLRLEPLTECCRTSA